MRLLLIDTCGAEGSVALASADGVTRRSSLPGRSASERLLPVIRELLAEAGWRLRDLDAIVVVHGPGSFTGVRVGLSAAKGLSEAAGVGLIAISRLAVLASLAGSGEDVVCAALDAGRGEFYGGLYRGQAQLREALLTGEELRAEVREAKVLVVCEARAAETLADLSPQLVREPEASDALPLAVKRFEVKSFDDVATIDANYLRRTDLEILAKAAAR